MLTFRGTLSGQFLGDEKHAPTLVQVLSISSKKKLSGLSCLTLNKWLFEKPEIPLNQISILSNITNNFPYMSGTQIRFFDAYPTTELGPRKYEKMHMAFYIHQAAL